ncbi:MAG: 50S ribosomal protein L18 [Deltaproteobacteria bacterium]|nr:50S ribosomal protein L18 [Deltaproteobacteria bacterium]MBW1952780.1 50S ribosomal protein L18 [Deltaproteobacteria bacterium]MBW1987099.1 50S ribosomal protein L18 [Deltaproteobacteria bacterium]MBW2135389.1 50S ribosomal protein L18 [Deltaproteobacteria bacterium]
MAQRNQKQEARRKRKKRVRKKIFGVESRPRLTVFKTARHIYAQIIDDLRGHTLVAASTLDKELRDKAGGLKGIEKAREVGVRLALKAKQVGIHKVAFDRNGFLYHGRIKGLADSCREQGLEF